METHINVYVFFHRNWMGHIHHRCMCVTLPFYMHMTMLLEVVAFFLVIALKNVSFGFCWMFICHDICMLLRLSAHGPKRTVGKGERKFHKFITTMMEGIGETKIWIMSRNFCICIEYHDTKKFVTSDKLIMNLGFALWQNNTFCVTKCLRERLFIESYVILLEISETMTWYLTVFTIIRKTRNM